MVYHLLNEVVENGAYEGYNTDAIADLLFFDPASMVLFSFDSVCRFFSHTLHMNDWSYQICYDPFHRTLENNGQNFVVKWRIPRHEGWGLFYHWGTHGEFGVCRTDERGECWSFGVGLKAGEVVRLGHGQKTVDLVMVAGARGTRCEREGNVERIARATTRCGRGSPRGAPPPRAAR